MLRYSLAEEDRERFGCAEWLELDLEHIPVDDCIAIEEAGGDYETLDQPGVKNVKARVWLALRRAGHKPPPFAAFTFDVIGFRSENLGKAQDSDDEPTDTPPTSPSSSE